MRNLLLRFVFGLTLAAASLVIARLRLPRIVADLQKRRFDLLYIVIYFLSHIFIFALAFFVLHQTPHGDLPGYYVPQAHSVIHGLVPYRDFKSSYAPLNPYLDAAILLIHDSPLSILLFQILCESASLPFWVGFLRRCLPETLVRKAAVLYLIQPLVIWGTCIDGKNHGCITLLLGIAFYTVARKEVLSGVSYSLSIVLVKILPLMFLPTLFVAASKRIVWLVSALMLPVLVYGGFLFYRIDVTVPIRVEGSFETPANLPYLVASLFGEAISKLALNIVALTVTGAAVAFATVAQLQAQNNVLRCWRLLLSSLLVLFSVLIFTKKSDPSYLTMVFFLICALAAVEAERAKNWAMYIYALLSAIVLPVTSFWFWPLGQVSAVRLHDLFLIGDKNAIVMIVAQALLLFCYSWFAWEALSGLKSAQTNGILLTDPAEDIAGGR